MQMGFGLLVKLLRTGMGVDKVLAFFFKLMVQLRAIYHGLVSCVVAE